MRICARTNRIGTFALFELMIEKIGFANKNVPMDSLASRLSGRTSSTDSLDTLSRDPIRKDLIVKYMI